MKTVVCVPVGTGQGLFVAAGCLIFILCLTPGSVFSRENKVSGGFSSGYSWYQQRYEDDSAQSDTAGGDEETDTVTIAGSLIAPEDDESGRLSFAPFIDIASLSARNEVSLYYKPTIVYDHVSDDAEFNHDLSVALGGYLTRTLRLDLSNAFVFTDNVEDDGTRSTASAAQGGSSGSDAVNSQKGRRRFLKNSADFSASYNYWEDSSLTLLYSYEILDTVDAPYWTSYEDYQRHSVSVENSWQLSSVYRISSSLGYERGLFTKVSPESETAVITEEEENNDSHEFRAATSIDALWIEHHPLSLAYDFYGIDYDAVGRNSRFVHNLTAGWRWEFAKDSVFGLGGGPTYTTTDTQEDDWNYNVNFIYAYSFNHGSIEWTGEHGLEQLNFSGFDEHGQSAFYQSRLTIEYQLLESCNISAFAGYRWEDFDDISTELVENDLGERERQEVTTNYNRQQYSAGVQMSYSFMEWYALKFSYRYLLQDSEKFNDSYDEHRISLNLEYSQQWLQW